MWVTPIPPVFGGLLGVVAGAHLLLIGAEEIALQFQIPPLVIGLSPRHWHLTTGTGHLLYRHYPWKSRDFGRKHPWERYLQPALHPWIRFSGREYSRTDTPDDNGAPRLLSDVFSRPGPVIAIDPHMGGDPVACVPGVYGQPLQERMRGYRIKIGILFFSLNNFFYHCRTSRSFDNRKDWSGSMTISFGIENVLCVPGCLSSNSTCHVNLLKRWP